ncbi:hypothetical protein SDRG_16087 [Saprolegnia diclina VS20]|uniref:Histone-lysine N-methyltransferase, H3 lysine-79 specific n=1 Tax=Saprolegnia diclina (strain VS20) TaxID=1156394 RepID=T0R228_SAPDV|nr:hypothetical protein SDRG_16087 [Saprolegnia diclina VS20]EQC26068.1 hypothetical protein SDRG_16087 [Saprolegnia diclina VS20]|eukprot:XP_008620505.1 hypothetical protein SDRG_16087 [Saprolegnia diclina VS20]
MLPEVRWLRAARLLPPQEGTALKEMVVRRDPRLQALATCQDDTALLRLVAAEVVSAAFRAWYAVYDNIAMSTDAARSLHDNTSVDDGGGCTLSSSLVYGEVDFFGFARLLEALAPQAGQVFYDLGHGTGRAVLAAALLHPQLTCVGIELVHALVKASWVALHAMPLPNVILEHGDILTHAAWWRDGDIVFVNCTCFTADLFRAVEDRACCMKPGSLFVSLTKRLRRALPFTRRGHMKIRTSWGHETASTLC